MSLLSGFDDDRDTGPDYRERCGQCDREIGDDEGAALCWTCADGNAATHSLCEECAVKGRVAGRAYCRYHKLRALERIAVENERRWAERDSRANRLFLYMQELGDPMTLDECRGAVDRMMQEE